ncbi:hypothetical protein D9M73_68820 [compost metagenome]
MAHQHRQRVYQVVEIAVIKGNANHLARALATQIGLEAAHGQTCVAQPFQPGHLACECSRRHIQAAKRPAFGRRFINLVINQNRDRLRVLGQQVGHACGLRKNCA